MWPQGRVKTTMNSIGVDTTTVAENDETRDLEFTSFDQINDMKVAFPNLRPGRALVNLETNELIEIFHSVIGNWKTSGGTLSHLEERRLDDKVGTQWGGIIQEKYVAHRITDCPASNHHGEVPVPEERPEKSEIVERSPEEFFENVLEIDSKTPFMLLERPSVDYAEVGTGETYEVVGSYWPQSTNPENRVRDADAITEEFEGLDVAVGRTEVETHPVIELPEFNVSLTWGGVDSSSVVQFEETETGRIKANVKEDGKQETIHLFDHHTDDYNTDRVHIDSPISAKDDIKDLNWEQAHPNWDADFGEHGAWRFDADAFDHAIKHLLKCEYAVTVSADVVATLGVESAEYVSHVADADEVAIEREQQAQEGFDASIEAIVDDWDTDKDVSVQAVRTDNPTLLGLDLTLGEGGQMDLDTGITVSGTLDTIDGVPESVAKAWQPAISASADDSDEDGYEWYNSSSGARISVEEVEGKWGAEYEITVEHQYAEPETIATLADERHVVETVITHLRAMT